VSLVNAAVSIEATRTPTPVVAPGNSDESTEKALRAEGRERLVVFAMASLVLLVAIITITPWPVGAFQDDAIYTILAKALATGQGYRMIDLPGSPNATHYPPGYPLVLSILWKLWPDFPRNVTLFKFANAFFLSAAAVGTYRYVRSRFGAPVSAAAAAALAGTLSIVILLITGVVLSEPLFMALLLPTLIACERACDDGEIYSAFIAGLLIGALAMVRTVGVFVLPAAGLVFLVRRQWKSIIAVALGSAIFLVPWQLWVSAHQGEIAHPLVGKYGSYGSWLVEGYRKGGFPFARAVIEKNLGEMDNTFSFMIMPVQERLPRLILVIALLVFIVAGTRRHWRKAPVSLVFLAGYMLVVMLWPFEPSRFILAIWPLWFPLIACGVLACWHVTLPSAARLPWRFAIGTLVAALIAGTSWYNGMGYTRKWWVSIQKNTGERAKPTIEWVARYTKPNDVVSTEDDLLVYLYTGRKAVPTATFTALERVYPLTDAEDMAEVQAIFKAYKPRYYLVAGPQGVRTSANLAKANPPVLKPLGSNPSVLIYERIAR
jgi:hypothetical protein